MEDQMNLEIKLISREIIKPSTPTPLHLKTIKLSLIDQLFTPSHTPLLLYYNVPPNTPPLQITTLKSSLSRTLSQFYPLAGRCIDDSTVSCNDQGVPFIETHINSPLTDFLDSPHKLDYLTQLLPPREFFPPIGQPISDLVPLVFQINVFACGGVVIGCSKLHKFLDMSSFATFLKYWAAIAAQRSPNLVDPNFDPIFNAFPPFPSMDPVIVVDPPAEFLSVVVLSKSFRFTKTAINHLKAMAATEAYPNPTSFETVTAFVWENVVAAASIAQAAAYVQVQETTVVSMTINMRPRTNPPLPRDSMGNCVFDMQTKATRQGMTFQELVWEIHGSVSEAKSIVEKFQGVNGAEIIREYRMVTKQIDKECHSNVYRVTSWCKLGLNDADFGFGKLNLMIPIAGKVPKRLRNKIAFTDYEDDLNGQGIEMWLFLEEKEMQVLLTNPRFLEFASHS